MQKIHLRSKIVCAVVVLALGMFGAVSAHAQKYLGGITGVVTDPSGARVANATITATDTITKFVSKTTSNASGEYTIPFITPSTYDVAITAPGFGAQATTGVVITAGDTADVSFALKLGAASSAVTVNAEAVQLDTQSALLSTTISTAEVVDTPLIGRNPFVFTTLAAGIETGAYTTSTASGYTNPFSGTAVQVTVNGNSGHVRLTLDGIPDDPAERLSGTNYTGFVPSPEAVQEVKVQTTLFDAQYGHGDGVENTVLRSGTNAYHGAGYYVFQNTYMNANSSARVPLQNSPIASSRTPRSNDQWSQPGVVFDGPLSIPHLYNGHDKTFFMVAYERIQARSLVSYTADGLVPTAAERTGDFSALCSSFTLGVCNPGDGIQIYDPTQRVAANGNRVPFMNNQIPSSYFAAGSNGAPGAALMALYPLPNSTSGGANINYIPAQTAFPERYYSLVTRVDHSFSPSDKMNAAFFKAVLNQLQPNDGFPTPIGISGSDYTVYRNDIGGNIDNVWAANPNLVVDARLGVIFHPFGLLYNGLTYDLASLGINATGIPYQSFPGTSFSDNYSGLAAGAGGQISTFTLISPSILVSKVAGKHNFRVGFDSNFDKYNVQNPQSGLGTFGFNRQFTQENSTGETGSNCPVASCVVDGDSTSGNALADELVGVPSSGSYGNNVAYALSQVYFAGFVQDDWHLTDKLTLNLGLRWDYESPFTERHNQLVSSFCTTCTNPMQSEVSGLSLPGGLQFVNYGDRFPFPADYRHWQPRLGAAYQIMPRVVLRGGFALVYLNTLESPLGTGFSASTNYVATTDNVNPANYLSDPFPNGIVLPTGNTLGLATALGQGVSYNDPHHVQPQLLQYSVSTQVQLPLNLLLQVAYEGQQTSKIEVNKAVDGLPAQYFNQGSAEAAYLNAQVPNPMYGAAMLPTSSFLNSPTIQQSYLLVPYPEFYGSNYSGVTDDYASTGEQLFNSLQITVVKRLTHGFSAQGNFNWEKLMDQNVYLNPGQNDFPDTFRYQDAIPTLIGNFIATYEVPSFLHSAVGRSVVGGWTINTVLRAQNGSLVSSPTNVNVKQLTNPAVPSPSGSEYFNTCYENAQGQNVITVPNVVNACASSTSVAAFEELPSYSLVVIGPTMESVRARVYPLLDTSIFKKFTIHKTLNFEIRGEIYNIANTPIFGGPNTSLGSAQFGTISPAQANDPRIIQLTARINF